MAQVTVELRNLINFSNFKLFDFPYTFDDLTFKAQLEKMVTDFFYDYEIGKETPDSFKHSFRSRWERIIPYYNDLYNTTLLSYNPLSNYKVSELFAQLAKGKNDTLFHDTTKDTKHTTNDTTFHATSGTDTTGTLTSDDDNTVTHTGTNKVATTNDSNVKSSDFPQQAIGMTDYLTGEQITTGSGNNDTTLNLTDHTINGNVSTSEGSSDTLTDSTNGIVDHSVNDHISDTTTGNTSELNTDYTKTIEGITGTSYPELLMKHRQAILRIQDDIIREMKPCFILSY